MNRQWILVGRPTGLVSESDFELRTASMPVPGHGEALVRVEWLGVDPTQRGWLNDGPNYMEAVALGDVMRGSGVGTVLESNDPAYAVGDHVVGMLGWQEFAVVSGQGLFGAMTVPPGVDPKAMLSVFGTTGLTAYFGMVDIGKPIAGETVLVSGAAGATGSIAGQIAKALGAKVIGIAGGAEKCAWVTGTAMFDECIDYRSAKVEERIRELAPEGVDVFFDNVGGSVLDAALANLALNARVVVCGGVSSGYESAPPPGPRNYLQLCLRRARMEGFLFLDYVDRFPEAFGRLQEWDSSGQIVYAESILDGLEQAPAALRGLFEGRNLGKQLLRVSP